ncbi:MAG: cyclic pyranopterin monophosphate synthase MoaC [Thermoprotei archaeon]|nr:MAG: cyclic pyranopterin monophosphate synthase MoaC [Thermoprotei archaeon]RLF22412.1 MAG: cyclic pyranopterin monophosphate synthase MoaC [Thermoprotei archaeon]
MSVRMVDITSKADVYREAEAEGFIKLRRETLEKVLKGEVEKGDVFSVTQVAAMLAAKKTPEVLPLCHPLPITNVDVKMSIENDGIKVSVKVKSVGKTGVEMEALTATAVALLNVWDMVKKYEKDEEGQYPYTEIVMIRVKSKVKREVYEQNG